MKRIDIENGEVKTIWQNGTYSGQMPATSFEVEDTVEVYNGYTSNGDGTFTAPPPPDITRNQVNEERERRKVLPVNALITGDVVEYFPTDNTETTHTDAGSGMVISMDMRDERDRINLLGLTTKGSLLLSTQSAELTKIYTADDKVYKLTAVQLIQLGLQAGNHDGDIYDKANKLKAMDPIPDDYATNEQYWTTVY